STVQRVKVRRLPGARLFPYTTLFRSEQRGMGTVRGRERVPSVPTSILHEGAQARSQGDAWPYSTPVWPHPQRFQAVEPPVALLGALHRPRRTLVQLQPLELGEC